MYDRVSKRTKIQQFISYCCAHTFCYLNSCRACRTYPILDALFVNIFNYHRLRLPIILPLFLKGKWFTQILSNGQYVIAIIANFLTLIKTKSGLFFGSVLRLAQNKTPPPCSFSRAQTVKDFFLALGISFLICTSALEQNLGSSHFELRHK